jgi:WXG100 family type VII secretion target
MVFQDTAASKAAQSGMDTAIHNMRSTLKQITSAIDGVKWQGDARVAFEGAQASWDQEAARLNARLDAIHAQVGTGTDGYNSMDQEGQSDFQHLQGLKA